LLARCGTKVKKKRYAERILVLVVMCSAMKKVLNGSRRCPAFPGSPSSATVRTAQALRCFDRVPQGQVCVPISDSQAVASTVPVSTVSFSPEPRYRDGGWLPGIDEHDHRVCVLLPYLSAVQHHRESSGMEKADARKDEALTPFCFSIVALKRFGSPSSQHG
jgi:hypothetical protein